MEHPTPGHLPTILIVEDNAALRSSLAEILSYQYHVLIAENGEQGWDLLAQHHGAIQVLLTDINMPGMNGLDLLTKATQHYPAVQIVVMTGIQSSQLRQKLAQRRVITYLQKPFSFTQLHEHIERALRQKRQRKGFHGQVQVLGLFDIVQLYCFSRATVVLSVTHDASNGQEHGAIYFEGGHITNAVVGEKHGEDAFYDIMSWEGGTFQTTYGLTADQIAIHTHWEPLLLEAIRRSDEKTRPFTNVDDQDSVT